MEVVMSKIRHPHAIGAAVRPTSSLSAAAEPQGVLVAKAKPELAEVEAVAVDVPAVGLELFLANLPWF